MRQADCMACLTVGIAMTWGVVDAGGIVHYVKWAVARRHGCFRLCDFDGEALGKDKIPVDVNTLISVEEP